MTHTLHNCTSQALIPPYLDGQLSREERKEMARHLDHCAVCRNALAELKRLSEWTEQALNDSLAPLPDESDLDLDTDASWHRFQQRLAEQGATPAVPVHLPPSREAAHRVYTQQPIRRWSTMAKTYKKWLVGAAAAAVVLGSLSIPQVQAAASNLLSVFRVERVELVKFSEEDLNKVERWFYHDDNTEASLGSLGKLWRTDSKGQNQYRHFESPQLAKAAGFTPPAGPQKFDFVSHTVTEASTVHFQFNTEQANLMMKQLGYEHTLNAKLNNKEFSVTWPQTTRTTFISQDVPGMILTYNVSESPNISVPQGVDVEELRQTVLNLPFIPKHIAQQLNNIEDWKTTLPLPVNTDHETAVQKVRVGAGEAIYMEEKENESSTLLWQQGGKLHQLQLNAGNGPIRNLQQLTLEYANTFNH